MNRCAVVVLWMFAVSVLTACRGGTPMQPVAAGTDMGPDAGADAGLAIAEPASPAQPGQPSPAVLIPCPVGWREVEEASGVVARDPWPAAGYPVDCAWDGVTLPGSPGCVRVGTLCAVDGWPTELPTNRPIVYVDDSAGPGGDGASSGTAFASIAAATAAAPDGAVIAVATGQYDETVSAGAG